MYHICIFAYALCSVAILMAVGKPSPNTLTKSKCDGDRMQAENGGGSGVRRTE